MIMAEIRGRDGCSEKESREVGESRIEKERG